VNLQWGLCFGHWFGSSPSFCMNLQALHDVRLAEQESGAEVAEHPRQADA